MVPTAVLLSCLFAGVALSQSRPIETTSQLATQGESYAAAGPLPTSADPLLPQPSSLTGESESEVGCCDQLPTYEEYWPCFWRSLCRRWTEHVLCGAQWKEYAWRKRCPNKLKQRPRYCKGYFMTRSTPQPLRGLSTATGAATGPATALVATAVSANTTESVFVTTTRSTIARPGHSETLQSSWLGQQIQARVDDNPFEGQCCNHIEDIQDYLFCAWPEFCRLYWNHEICQNLRFMVSVPEAADTLLVALNKVGGYEDDEG